MTFIKIPLYWRLEHFFLTFSEKLLCNITLQFKNRSEKVLAVLSSYMAFSSFPCPCLAFSHICAYICSFSQSYKQLYILFALLSFLSYLCYSLIQSRLNNHSNGYVTLQMHRPLPHGHFNGFPMVAITDDAQIFFQVWVTWEPFLVNIDTEIRRDVWGISWSLWAWSWEDNYLLMVSVTFSE